MLRFLLDTFFPMFRFLLDAITGKKPKFQLKDGMACGSCFLFFILGALVFVALLTGIADTSL
jgi:hypothetical protein